MCIIQCVQGECRLFIYYVKYLKSLHFPWPHYSLCYTRNFRIFNCLFFTVAVFLCTKKKNKIMEKSVHLNIEYLKGKGKVFSHNSKYQIWNSLLDTTIYYLDSLWNNMKTLKHIYNLGCEHHYFGNGGRPNHSGLNSKSEGITKLASFIYFGVVHISGSGTITHCMPKGTCVIVFFVYYKNIKYWVSHLKLYKLI